MKKSLKTIDSSQNEEQNNGNFDSNNENLNIGSFESNIENNFFYAPDKIINQSDNDEILSYISKKYPNLNLSCEDSQIKKEFINLLNDIDFVDKILNFYNISIYDFFKLNFKTYLTIFKGPFLKKIKNLSVIKKYAEKNKHKKRQ